MNIFASLAGLLGYALFFLILPDIAWAADGDENVNTVLKSVRSEISGDKGLVFLIGAIYYIIAIALIAKGLLNAKKQSEGGQGSGLSGWLPIFGPIAVGALLIAMESYYSLILLSLGMSTDVEGGNYTVAQEICENDGNTVGASICRIYKDVGLEGGGYMDDILSIICIIVGIMVIGSALMGAYRLSTAQQGAPKISGIVWRSIGGALLIALPSAIDLIRKSIFDNPEFGSRFAMSSFDVVEGEGLDRALTFMVNDIKDPAINIIFFVAYIIGAITIARTLYAMSGINFEQQKMSTTSMISRFIIGGCLMSAWSIYRAVTMTVMGGSENAIGHTLAYSADALDAVTATKVNNIMNAAFVWVQLVGLIAFFRGFLVLKSSLDGQQGGSISAGLTHLIAGALCINIPWTIIMIQNTIPGIEILTDPG